MEVSLPSKSIHQNFDDPIALGLELENLQEGHYTRRLYDYIHKGRRRLKFSITLEATLLPIRRELNVRIRTSDLVRNTLEQLAILDFEQEDFLKKLEDFRKKLEDLKNLMEKVESKFQKLKDCKSRCWFPNRFLFWRKATKRIDLSKEIEELQGLFEKMESEFRKLRDDLILRALRKYGDTRKQVLERNNITGVDGVLRMRLMEFNAMPYTFTSIQSLTAEREMGDLRYNFKRFVFRFNEDSRSGVDAMEVIFTIVLCGSAFILGMWSSDKLFFQKPILK